MKKRIIVFSVLLILLIGCKTTPEVEEAIDPKQINTEPESEEVIKPSKINIVFNGDKCTYKGPGSVQAGQITMNWEAKGIPRDSYGIALVSLEDGKTFKDLDDWASTDKPTWAKLLDYREATHESFRFYTYLWDGTVYIVCFTAEPGAKVGVLGPINVLE